MGDDERRFAPGKPMERRIDVGFGSGIQTGNRFIQDQDRRVTHNGASQIEASLLAPERLSPPSYITVSYLPASA